MALKSSSPRSWIERALEKLEQRKSSRRFGNGLKTAMASSTNTSTFNFLLLPAELRNEIYSYLLHFDTPPMLPMFDYDIPAVPDTQSRWGPQSKRSPKNLWFGNLGISLAIFRVNKQIHDEALRFFFAENTFPIYVEVLTSPWIPKIHVEVSFFAPWETLKYRYVSAERYDCRARGLWSVAQADFIYS